MSKHSPGPWTVDDWMIRSADRESILDATGDSFPGDLDLAAAAPEMLELLREMEWSEDDDCPICGGQRYSRAQAGPHEPGCKLAALLKRIEGP